MIKKKFIFVIAFLFSVNAFCLNTNRVNTIWNNNDTILIGYPLDRFSPLKEDTVNKFSILGNIKLKFKSIDEAENSGIESHDKGKLEIFKRCVVLFCITTLSFVFLCGFLYISLLIIGCFILIGVKCYAVFKNKR